MPAGDLDLTDGPSDDEPDQFRSYRELLFGDVGQVVNAMGQLEDECLQFVTDPVDERDDVRAVPAGAGVDERRTAPTPRAASSARWKARRAPGRRIIATLCHQVSYACSPNGSTSARSTTTTRSSPRRIDAAVVHAFRAAARTAARTASSSRPAHARADEPHKILIADPFIELHTGPGRGYPVFHVIERGREVTIVKRRTDWFQLRTDRGVEGWAPREQMIATLEPTGEPLDLQEPARENYMSRRWQAGVMAGDFGGASLVSVFGGYAFSDNLSIELTLNHILGEFSNGYSATLGLMHVFVPEWRISPYFTLGTGVIYTEPKSTLVQSIDRDDQIGYVGGGLQFYLTRRFMLRSEYRNNVIFTSRDDNEEVDEWKYLGFAFFF